MMNCAKMMAAGLVFALAWSVLLMAVGMREITIDGVGMGK